MNRVGLNGFFRERMPLLRQYVKASDKLLAEMLPALRNHFLQENVQPAVYLHQWYLTLFINVFPIPMVLVVWDVIMCSGFQALLSVTVAILELLKDGLLQMQFEEIHRCFKAMRKYQDGRTNASQLGKLLMKHSEQSAEVPDDIVEYLNNCEPYDGSSADEQ